MLRSLHLQGKISLLALSSQFGEHYHILQHLLLSCPNHSGHTETSNRRCNMPDSFA